MERKLIPGGEFVYIARVKQKNGSYMSAYFTMTAYDKTGGRWIGGGHYNCFGDGVGSIVFRAYGRMEAEKENAKIRPCRVDVKTVIGRVSQESAMGSAGACGSWYPDREEVEIGTARPGRGRVLNECFPGGGVDVDILTSWGGERLPDGQGGSDPVDFAVSFPRGFPPAAGCSGSPILQDGRIVGAIWGKSSLRNGVCVCRDISKMLGLLDQTPKKEAVSTEKAPSGKNAKRRPPKYRNVWRKQQKKGTRKPADLYRGNLRKRIGTAQKEITAEEARK